MLENLQQKINYWQFSKKQQQAFLEDISQLIADGVPANQAVQTVAQIATGQTKEVAQEILRQVAEGKLFSDGMRGWFPDPIVEIIRAGEEGGTLADNMAAAVRALSRQSKGIASLLNSLVYPLTVIIMGLFVAVFVKHSVFENFVAIKPMNQWPANGIILYNVATFVESWWWLILLVLIGLVALLAQSLRSVTGQLRQNLDKLPLFSLYRETTAARFMETLGLLLSNGIPIKRALALLRSRANDYLAWHIYMMEFRLSGGRENIAEVLDTGLLPAADVLRLRVIAKGKGFEHALVRMGQLSAEHASKKIDVTGKIIGMTLLGIGAAWAAFMIFAIYGVGSSIAT